MKDDLKQYVNQNRREFDLFKPPSRKIWQAISANLDKETSRVSPFRILSPFYRIAAILIVGLGVLFYAYRSQYQSMPSSQLNAISSELKETENYYQGLIDEKMEFVRANANLIDPIIIEDLEVLDEAFVQLKDDLAENVDNEEVVTAMIKNYRIKLKILERILKQIQSKETPDEAKANI